MFLLISIYHLKCPNVIKQYAVQTVQLRNHIHTDTKADDSNSQQQAESQIPTGIYLQERQRRHHRGAF